MQLHQPTRSFFLMLVISLVLLTKTGLLFFFTRSWLQPPTLWPARAAPSPPFLISFQHVLQCWFLSRVMSIDTSVRSPLVFDFTRCCCLTFAFSSRGANPFTVPISSSLGIRAATLSNADTSRRHTELVCIHIRIWRTRCPLAALWQTLREPWIAHDGGAE